MKPGIKRLIGWSGALVLFALLLLLLIHTSPVKRLVRSLVCTFVSRALDAELAIGKLDYRLWRGEVRADEVNLTFEDAEIRVELALPEVDLELSFAPAARVQRPRLGVFLLDGVEEEGEPAPDDWFFVSYLPAIELREGEVLIQFDETQWLQLDDIEGSGGWNESQRFGIEARASGGSLHVADGALAFGPMDAKGNLSTGQGLEVEDLNVQATDSTRLKAQGALKDWSPVLLSVGIKYTLDAAVAQAWFPDAELLGALNGSALLEYKDDGFRGEARVRDGSLRWGESRPLGVQGRLELDRDVLFLKEMAFTGYGGRMGLDARIELASGGEQSLQMRLSNLDVEGISKDWVEVLPPVASRAQGEGEITLKGWDLGMAEVRARAELRPGNTSGALPVSGSLTLSGRSPRYDVDARFSSAPLGTELEIDAQVGREAMRAAYQARFSKIEDAWAWFDRGGFIPAGVPDLHLSGKISAAGRIEGPPAAPTWTAAVRSADVKIGDEPIHFSADLDGDVNQARLDLLRIEGQQGILSATGSVPLDRHHAWNIDLNLSDVSIDSLMESYRLPVKGTLRGRGRMIGNFADPDWRVEAYIDSESLLGELPGVARLFAEKQGSRIELTELSAETAQASLEGSGTYLTESETLEGRLAWKGFSLGAWVPEVEGLEGRLAGEIEVAGSVDSPQIRANLRAEESTFRGQTIEPASLNIITVGDRAEFELRLGDEPLARGSGQLTDAYPLRFEVDLAALPLTPILQGYTEVESEVGITGRLIVEVPLTRPEELHYRAVVESYEAEFPRWSHRSSGFTVEGDRESLRIDGLELVAEDRRFSVRGVVPLTRESPLDLNVNGEFELEPLGDLVEDLVIEGRGRVDLQIRGTYAAPDLAGELGLDGVSGSWRHFEWDGVELRARAEENRLKQISVRGNVLDGKLDLQGEIPLALRNTASPGRLEIVLEGLDLDRLVTEDFEGLPAPSIVLGTRGYLEISKLALEGIQGSGEITEVAFKVGNAEARNPEPASWRLEDSSFSVPSLRLEGGATNLNLTMSLGPVRFGDELAWRGAIRGTLDNTLLNTYLLLSGMEIAGTSDLDFELSDGPAGFEIGGHGSLTGGRFSLPDPPLTLSDLQGTVTIEQSKVQIAGVTARVGGGRLSGESSIDLTDPAKPMVDFRAEARGVRLQLAEGLRAQLSGSVRFRGQENFVLSGDLIVNQGFFNRELDENDRLMSSSFALPGGPAAEDSFAERVSLEASLQTEETVRVDTKQAQLEAGGNLSVAGTLASPEIAGNLSLSPDGTFAVGRNRFRILDGRLEFRDYPVSPPRLVLTAVTRVGSTLIRLDLNGDIDDLHTRLSAPEDPNLTEGDLASLLVTGRTLENAGEGGQQIASTWAMSSLADLLHEGWGDLFTFGPPPGSGPLIFEDEENPTSRLTLGRAITERLSITYSVALDKTEDQLWILDYQVARNVWVRTIQRRGNEYSLGFSHRFNVDIKPSSVERTGEEEQEVLSGVSVTGDYPGTEAEWLKHVRVKVGSRRDYWAAQEDARRIQEKLVEQGFRSAVVDADMETTEGQANLVFRIQAGPRVELTWEGDDPGGELKRKTEQAWNGRIPEAFLIADLAHRATWELRSQRYYLARVTGRVEETEKGQKVVFTTVKGPRGAAVRLDFQGNEAVSDTDLAEALPATDTPEFFLLLDKPSELEKGIRLLYASRGYLDASTGTTQTRYDERSKELHVVVPVSEGSLWRIMAIRFDGAVSLSPEAIGSAASLQEGQPFSLPKVRDAQVKIRSYYRENGFPDVKVHGGLEEAPGGVAVTFRIDEGALAEVGHIRIVGATRTREPVIKRQLTFQEGDAVRISELQESQSNLYDTRVFSSVDVRVDSGQEGEKKKDILVQVAERPDLDVSYGLRYNLVTETETSSTDVQPEGLEGILRASLFNAFGQGTILGFSAFVQSERTLFRATERFPTFFDFRLPTELILELERKTEIVDLETRNWSIAFQQTKAWRQRETGRDNFAVQWNVRTGRLNVKADRILEPVLVDVEGDPQPGSLRIDEREYRTIIGASLIEDRRNSLSNPTRGRFWNVTLQVAPKFLGSDTQYVRFYGQLFYHRPLFKTLVWASSYRLGLAQGSTEFLYIEDRFKAGGANSVRGFKQDSLGPSIVIPETNEEWFIGGQAVVVMNQELRFPIYKMLHGGVFYDTGNVFPRVRDLRLSDLRHSAGAGLRLVLPFGALRLDWARILDLQEGEKPSRWHFGFGYAF